MQWQSSSGLSPLLPFAFIVFGCAAGLAQTQTAALEPDHDRTVLAQSFAQEKLWAWQKRLNLKEWNITLLVARASELKPKTLGNVHWDMDKKTAIIRILDPADYKLPFKAMLDDMEFTVVHELIHLDIAPVLTDLKRNEANRREEEYSVNRVTEALLGLDRQK